jgi:hypothetical protein
MEIHIICNYFLLKNNYIWNILFIMIGIFTIIQLSAFNRLVLVYEMSIYGWFGSNRKIHDSRTGNERSNVYHNM